MKSLKGLNGEKIGHISELMTSEVDKVRSLKNCITCLKIKGDFSSEARELRHKTITLDHWEDFVSDLTITRILQSTGCITFNPPPGLAGSSRRSSHQLTPVESLKRIIKRDSSQFTISKKESIGII